MEIRHANIDLEIKEVDGETGHFQGLANGTEIMDVYGDIVHEGAFKKTIKERKGKMPVLKGHDSAQEIGATLKLSENGPHGQGLNFEDAFLYVDDSNPKNEVSVARDELVRMRRRQEIGMPMGISIGFVIPEGKSEFDDQGVRHIYEVRLWEMSTTPFPANLASMVSNVKTIAEMPAMARRVASGCTGPLCAKNRDAVEKTIQTLHSLLQPAATTPKSEPAPVAKSAEKMSDPEFQSLMNRLGIPIKG